MSRRLTSINQEALHEEYELTYLIMGMGGHGSEQSNILLAWLKDMVQNVFDSSSETVAISGK